MNPSLTDINLGDHPVLVLLHYLPHLVDQLMSPGLGQGQLLGLKQVGEGPPVLPDDPGVECVDERWPLRYSIPNSSSSLIVPSSHNSARLARNSPRIPLVPGETPVGRL